ncbi:hypothetical protein Pmani_015240 [Petrolisthes manimaculis]|uniref:Uncharacterized protein n=1 Tax=Petrolisthes manimaculis TaxID=1843537 RepID=A0AAE1PR96_9EUCA|nr:hypothetical protein Pmani_015240 [Petrolisthes manimaculis]
MGMEAGKVGEGRERGRGWFGRNGEGKVEIKNGWVVNEEMRKGRECEVGESSKEWRGRRKWNKRGEERGVEREATEEKEKDQKKGEGTWQENKQCTYTSPDIFPPRAAP